MRLNAVNLKEENFVLKGKLSGNLGLIVIGAGLVLIGSAAYFLFPRSNQQNLVAELSSIPAAVNFPAPEISLLDMQNRPVSLNDYRGRVVLVNLWATWCPPCKQEMPIFQAFYEQHKKDGFTVVAINDGDPRQDVEKFVSDYKLTFSVWLDPTYTATQKAFRTVSLPSSYIVDRQGTVRLTWVGGIKREALEQYVTPIITE